MGSIEQALPIKEKLSKPSFPENANSLEFAKNLDAKTWTFRDQFIIPSKKNIQTKKLAKPGTSSL